MATSLPTLNFDNSKIDFRIQEKLVELQNHFDDNHPEMRSALKTIHGIIIKDPEQATLLTDEELSVIVAAQATISKTEISTKQLKKAPKKALKNTSVDDL